MPAGDLAAIVVAVVSLATTAVLTLTVASLVRTMRNLRGVLDTLHDQTLPLVADLRDTVDQAGADLERVEGILGSAERITHTVDAASQLTYRALSPPLIKTMSIVAGIQRAARRLRGRPAPSQTTERSSRDVEVHATHRPRHRRRGRESTASATRNPINRRR